MKSTLVHAARVLINVMEMGLNYTSSHSRQVAGYAALLAGELGMPEKEQQRIYLAGLLHDIGKVGIPTSILCKPSKLTAAEWEEIKKHPVYSYEILSAIPGMYSISIMALHHHERYDGNGYPEGVRGEAIPLGARILAIADSYDAMTSVRVYRPRMSSREALEECRRFAGTQFDPWLAERFCRLMECCRTDFQPDWQVREMLLTMK